MTDFIERYCHLTDIVNSYSDIAEPCASDLLNEHGLKESGAELSKTIEILRTEGRSLNIGIIGRVKAGKSSLLNSLFFNGKDILPKAATPMTAALTVISYGERPQAEITYYSGADIAGLRTEYEKYEELYHEYFSKLITDSRFNGNEKKVNREVRSKLKSNQRLDAAHEQYDMMINSGLLSEFASDRVPEIITADASEKLISILNERVGSSGRYMPFTKCVKLSLNIDALRDLEIVDTPGLDDPIVSRTQRTEEYLSKAEVVFIVSPAASFLSQEDFNLMDRLSGVKGEGIREIFLISSMTDTQLYGPEVIEESDHVLSKAVEHVNRQNAEHAVSIFREIDEGSKLQYGQLAQDTLSRLFPTSAIAGKMLASYANKDKWDDELNHIYVDLLHGNYEDSFSDDETAKASLMMLSGIDAIKTKISEIRLRKSEIQNNKCRDLISGRENAFNAVLRDLQYSITAQKHKLENSSLKITALEHEKLYGIKSVAECLINDAFDYSLKTLMSDMRNIFNRERRELMTKVRQDAENEKSTEIRQSSYTTGWWFWKKTHYRSYEVEVIRAGAVKGLLDNLINDLSNKISLAISESHSKWRQLLQSGVVQAFQESMPENYESVIITAGDIRMAVIKQVQAFDLEIPDLSCLSYRSIAPDIEKYSGKLEGSEGDSFIDATLNYLNLVGNGFNDYISKYLAALERQLKEGKNIGEFVFRNLDRRIEAIEEQLKNKEAMLKRFTLLEKDLKSV